MTHLHGFTVKCLQRLLKMHLMCGVETSLHVSIHAVRTGKAVTPVFTTRADSPISVARFLLLAFLLERRWILMLRFRVFTVRACKRLKTLQPRRQRLNSHQAMEIRYWILVMVALEQGSTDKFCGKCFRSSGPQGAHCGEQPKTELGCVPLKPCLQNQVVTMIQPDPGLTGASRGIRRIKLRTKPIPVFSTQRT